ncbi:type II toxin-antitoxin system HicB family antitoxin [Spirulina sp. CCNP1310]|uniref:type II toxin-antitoxin system HicB family antitoxin n=1 Tax=Spirulina sp. CCNP1310 TaxID=3110249 RepID=UPI002B1F67E5|nr:type II toxin-antitoxin system HicB family antitoxin [Spirulina sp. CCNP1310]MEA5418261.1 type II toxin-antitoxin system HicB family antitoxin [Spirulina sp. CCNP1310]
MSYPVLIYPSEKGGYVAEVPALKGCLAQGETLNETLEELEIVENFWIETAKKYGQTLPDVEGAIQKVKTLSFSAVSRVGNAPLDP